MGSGEEDATTVDCPLRFDNTGGKDQIANLVTQEGWAAFEPPLPQFVVAVAKARPGLLIDVGCNTGFYTLLAASAHQRNHVLASEPVQKIQDIARRNTVLNGVSDRVTFGTGAISDRNGAAELYIPADDHGMVETSASLNVDFKSSHFPADIGSGPPSGSGSCAVVLLLQAGVDHQDRCGGA